MGYSPWDCKELDMTEQHLLLRVRTREALSHHPFHISIRRKFSGRDTENAFSEFSAFGKITLLTAVSRGLVTTFIHCCARLISHTHIQTQACIYTHNKTKCLSYFFPENVCSLSGIHPNLLFTLIIISTN